VTYTGRIRNCITPPYLLRELLESDDRDVRQAALSTLLSTAQLRGERTIQASIAGNASPGDGRRTVFDCQHGTFLPSATLVRPEEGSVSTDDAVNRAFDGFGTTRQFYRDVLERNSIDDRGMRLDGYVHRGRNYNNAFWDGREMVFGDGDGKIFTDFTKSLDVIAHELTHGVTEHTAGLEYHNESGALNESCSDVFGSLVKQWSLKQSAADADWLIGSEVFSPGIEADALRSMKAPGTAYDNKLFGKDPQPDHMNKFVHLPDTEESDNGGVHINSGIPNKAFYLTALGIGGYAWEAAGFIWYESLRASSPKTGFQEFADTAYWKAGELFGAGGTEQQAVLSAWREVGIRVSGVPSGAVATRGRGAPVLKNGTGREAELLVTLTKQMDSLSDLVNALARDVAALKAKK
jgi:Zn-dependent metalloprotease